MRSKYTLYVLFSLLLLFYCSKSDQTYTIETKDGVNYVHNHAPLWGDEPEIALEFVQKIGDIDSDDENYNLYRHRNIEIDSDGNILVLDYGNNRIQKFDEHGRYLMTIGREGQGPGEFIRPFSMCVDNKGNVYVVDAGNRRFVVFASDGEYKNSYRTKRFFLYFRRLQSGNFIVQYSSIVMQDQKVLENHLLYILSPEFNEIKGFCELKDMKEYMLNNLFNEISFDCDDKDNIYVSFRHQNRIEKYSPEGDLMFVADRPLNYEITYKKIQIPGPENQTLDHWIIMDAVKSMAVDGKGRMWITTMVTQKANREEEDITKAIMKQREFQIFSTNGVWLGRLPLPKFFNHIRIFGDRLFLLDANVEMCIYEYKIVEK